MLITYYRWWYRTSSHGFAGFRCPFSAWIWKDKKTPWQGLLRIRGEVKKSDAVATLLATKAVQNMVLDPWTRPVCFLCFFFSGMNGRKGLRLEGVDSEARYLSWMFVALRELWRILGCAGHACSFIDLFMISDLLLTSYKIEGVDGSSDIWIHLICLLWLFLPEPMGFQIWPEQTIDIFLFHLGG